ncbi:hypothetical protein B0H63DRAFT_481514 [Podospora didyma]|uniref:MAPEG family protein n=1 Tax=Podospora didyma TaxID=330526 RepID=A0AAE0KE68_9PEZI|nr:hypothetical protein B0H63DRAFT_481514 [Podospora didyma]
MAALFDFGAANWSYYTVPAAFFMVMVPHMYSNILAGKNYDLANPYKVEEHCAKDTTFNKVTLKRIQRARAAAKNGFETLSLFAAAVVAANAAGVAAARLNALTLAYLASRAAYNYVYVSLQDNARTAPLRTLTWAVGIVIIMSLFVSAGNVVN